MSDNAIIGVNILETLTTGMYRDARVIFREYIQNSCDQIDNDIKTGLLKPGDGRIEIWINNDCVSIEDNATGIPAALFRKKLYSVGESDKSPEESRGFRGIGHWCGFAHCNRLVFTSKAKGESIESVMACDAEKMRSMMLEHRLKRAYYTIDDVLSCTTKFSTNQKCDVNSHYFKVEMSGIMDAKEELCDLQNVKEYLSFIIPVGYATEFRFRTQIHKYADEIGQHIEEYNISIGGEPILKKYQPSFSTHGKGDDTITGVQFKEFRDDNNNLVAWMWFGVSSFKAQMIPANRMRGIRLRSRNIQIGNEDALQRLFNESNGRGLYYYIGEVFSISNELLPDSQRDYFEPGNARTQFERLLYDFFNNELKSIYYAGSKVNSAFDKIDKAEQIEKAIADFGAGVTEEQLEKLEQAKREAGNAAQELAKIREKNSAALNSNKFGTVEAVVSEIIKKNEEKRAIRPSQPDNPTNKATATTFSLTVRPTATKASDKLVSVSKICDIIRALVDSSTAKAIIAKIEEELM